MHNYVVSYGSLFSHQNRPCFLGYNPPFKDICVVGYSPAQKSGSVRFFFFERRLFCSQWLHAFIWSKIQ